MSHLALPYRDHWMHFLFLPPKVIQFSGVKQPEPKIQEGNYERIWFHRADRQGWGGGVGEPTASEDNDIVARELDLS